MIQEIKPYIFKNEFSINVPDDDSVILIYSGRNILIDTQNESIFPLYAQIKNQSQQLVYAFKIDNTKFFIALSDVAPLDEFTYQNINILREIDAKKHIIYAGITGIHLYEWYKLHKYCGRCGETMVHSNNMRMMYCPNCKAEEFPRISPAVIVGVKHKDKLLMTKYAGRVYRKYALVAGFVEFGETPEEAAEREVFEETGVRIKNIRYYKSQPWGLSGSVLIGFYADLDGSDEITMDENELAVAEFISKKDIMTECDDFSLTNEMICKFKNE